MYIGDVDIQNFMALSSARLNLHRKGLVHINGVNNSDTSADSNGAGKSSIPDAVCWCIYGETARKVKGNEVVNDVAGKNCFVRAQIVDGDNEYRIERYRKDMKKKDRVHLYQVNSDGTETNLTGGKNSLTQIKIDEIMGSSLEIFKAAIYAGQEEMPNLPVMTDKHLKLIVEEAAGTDRIQQAFEIASKKRLDASKAVSNVENELALKHNELMVHKHSLETVIGQSNDWNELRDVAVHQLIDLISDKKDDIKAGLADFNKDRADEISVEIEKVSEQIAAVDHEKEQEALLSKAVVDADHSNRLLEAKLSDKIAAIKRMKGSFANAFDKIGTPCGECGKPYTAEDVEPAKKLIVEKMAVLVEEKKELEGKKESAAGALESASKELRAFTDTLTDVSELVERERDLRALHSEETTKRSTLMTQKSELQALADKLQAKRDEVNPLEAMKQVEIDQIAATESDIEAINKKLTQAKKHWKTMDQVCDVFGPAGVRAHILDNVTPFLNDRTAYYLSALSDGNISALWNTISTTAKGELREKFNIEVLNKKGAKSFAGLSGGEKRKVRVATAMALQDLVATRATKPIELFMADEVDDALDTAGLERLMNVLTEKAREAGTVIVISHNELSSYITQVASVIKGTNDLSVLRWI